MEAQEEVVGSSKEQTHIVKGKRTKRQRPQSPVPLAITTNSSSGDTDTNINTNTNTILSPTTSAHEFIHDSTEEEEDMANCLILLAQGQSPLKQIEDGIYKFNSRRYIQDASDNGKASGGLCVYECKTCSRTFPSFQALGGHRASHKKLKVMAEDQNKKQFVLSDEEAEGVSKNNYLSLPQPLPLSLQLGNIKGNLHSNNNNKANKVHECSVCGAEFTSGQALGGHMRRHRGPLMATNTSLSLTTNLALEPEEESEAKKPTRNLLSLDLNLPAPEDDHHHRESKFAFAAATSKQQQQQQQQSPALVFSAAPALVDCHY